MSGKAKKESRLLEIWRNYRRNKPAMIGLVILVALLLMAIFADVIVGYDKCIAIDATARLSGPSAGHWFGTDAYGRDEFARICHGARISLSIGLITTGVALLIGGILGAVAGYYGGRTDDIIMRIMDVFMCIPSILLSLAIVAALGTSMQNLIIAMTIAYVPSFTRLTRASILTVVDQDFIEAAKSYGAHNRRIIFKYILPNAIGPIIVQATMGISAMILSAASLSYMGMGIQPPAPEWGSMLSEAREYMRTAPYLLYFPGAFIVLSALSFNLVGDGLRDAMDPKLRG